MNSYNTVSEWDANDVFGREPILTPFRFPRAMTKAEKKANRNPGDLIAIMDRLVDAHKSRES